MCRQGASGHLTCSMASLAPLAAVLQKLVCTWLTVRSHSQISSLLVLGTL